MEKVCKVKTGAKWPEIDRGPNKPSCWAPR